MTFSEFSGGYYSTEMSIQACSDELVIDKYLYDFINREIYSQTDAPITIRFGLGAEAEHFVLDGADAVPTDVLGAPESLIDRLNLSYKERVFLLKPEYAYMIH